MRTGEFPIYWVQSRAFLERRGARGKTAARDVRAISLDVERCIDFAGAPKGGRACC
jgi:hypothetical protein